MTGNDALMLRDAIGGVALLLAVMNTILFWIAVQLTEIKKALKQPTAGPPE